MEKEITLVIMAAGLGSRFGERIKQLEPIGPYGELVIDYSVYDAVRAGFNHIVLIIRKDIEELVREKIGDRLSKQVKVSYAFQEKDDIPVKKELSSIRKNGDKYALTLYNGAESTQSATIKVTAKDISICETFTKHELKVIEI